MAHRSITIVLELDEAADSPSGSARLPDGTTRDFHGWLGLADVITALGRPPESEAADPHTIERRPHHE